MKSGTAAYWLPMEVRSSELDGQPNKHTGYAGKQLQSAKGEGVQYFLDTALSSFSDLYGCVVDTHFIIENIEKSKNGDTYDAHASIVVTGMVDGETHFAECIENAWPIDLSDQLHTYYTEKDVDYIVSFDTNPMQNGRPQWSQYNNR